MEGMGDEEEDGRERIGGGAHRPLSSIGEEEKRGLGRRGDVGIGCPAI
jgi:hypothetical protein